MQREEAERLRALLQYETLDSLPDPALDDIARLAAEICRGPYAYVGFIDASRVWFKARYGFEARETSRVSSACQYAMQSTKPLLIADACEDLRFPPEGIPLASGIHCRSYVGAPMVSPSGHVIGTLAVLSPEPNAFTGQQASMLQILAAQVVTRIELYARIRMQERGVRARQRIERALTVERNFVSAVLDTISALVLVLDTAGRIVRFNRACEKMSGYSFGELVGRSFPEELFLSQERAYAMQMIEEARAGKLVGNYEIHWLPRAGRKRRIAWTATPLTDANGEVNFIITTGVDITEQREAEVALRASETRYRQLVEGSLAMVCTHDLQGRILSINPHAAQDLGYSIDELVGKRMADLVPTKYRDDFERYLLTIQNTHEDKGLLYLRHKHGGVRVMAYSNKLIALPDEEPFILGHGIDITEKTDAEEKLHALMRQRESILESVGDGIYGMDMDGRLSFLNPSAANMLGYGVEEILGRNMHQLVHHTRADGTPYAAEDCPINTSLHRDTPIRVRDEVYWRQDGTSFPVEYVACPLVDNGRTTGIVVAFQDVTERRRLERMKDEFISTVSHELRTPLTSLRAALGLLAGGLLNERPEKTAQMLNLAVGNCDRLARLVNDILDFERIGSGKSNLSCAVHPAGDLLHRAAEVMQPSATKAEVRFRIESDSVDVWADGDRILQTLTNLIGNSIKFSAPGGEIRLCARLNAKGMVQIEVHDEGRGIPADKLGIIFERFQQVDASDSRAMGGTGLGLAICRSIVKEHGGDIWAESVPDKGSSFYLTLPMPVVALRRSAASR
ncbi:MAG TPA: PAS domain S-box protein [Acidisarcina sp.]|nr:PAS domain S-box protein [Acidisarcina sp.]